MYVCVCKPHLLHPFLYLPSDLCMSFVFQIHYSSLPRWLQRSREFRMALANVHAHLSGERAIFLMCLFGWKSEGSAFPMLPEQRGVLGAGDVFTQLETSSHSWKQLHRTPNRTAVQDRAGRAQVIRSRFLPLRHF